jgi:hypothetical protein
MEPPRASRQIGADRLPCQSIPQHQTAHIILPNRA